MSRRKKEKTEASFRELLGLDSRRSRPAPDKPTSPLCSETSWKTLTTAARRISVRFLPLRILRRSFATHLCENGADRTDLPPAFVHVRIRQVPVASSWV